MLSARYWQEAVQARGGVGPALLRWSMWLPSKLYGAGAWTYRLMYHARPAARTNPALPTISVGSIFVGGAGKTTATRFLANNLIRRGARVAIVLRGYGGRAKTTVAVSDGKRMLAGVDVAGDEAILLAQTCPGAVVVVNRRREEAIALAADMGAEVALLDDGFQYFRMARAVDIVLVNALQFGPQLRLFPAGILREPPAVLRCASQVWVTYASAVGGKQLDEVVAWCRRWAQQVPLVVCNNRLAGCHSLSDGQQVRIDGRRVAAFCGIGNPRGFELSLLQAGARDVAMRAFADHHRFTEGDLRRIARWAADANADVAVTTAKDAVRMDPKWWPQDAPPLAVADAALEVVAGAEHVEEAMRKWQGQ